MDSYKDIKGYAIGHHLGLNDSAFLKTLNAINYFATKTANTLKDQETKLAQMMIMGVSLMNQPAFASLESQIEYLDGRIEQHNVAAQLMQSTAHPMVIEFKELKDFSVVSETNKDSAYRKMMECFHIVKNKGTDIYNQILAETIMQYPVPSDQVHLLQTQNDVVSLQTKQRQQRFMAMDPVMFKILHYKRSQSQESIDVFEDELYQFTKKFIVWKGGPRKREESVAASDMGSVVQSV